MIEARLKHIAEEMEILLDEAHQSEYKLTIIEQLILSKISGRVEWLKERNK